MNMKNNLINNIKNFFYPEKLGYYNQDKEYCIHFNVVGAGILEFGKNGKSLCGDKAGFSLHVSWGKYGYAGGIISREDALILANHIIIECDKITESQKELENLLFNNRIDLIEFEDLYYADETKSDR